MPRACPCCNELILPVEAVCCSKHSLSTLFHLNSQLFHKIGIVPISQMDIEAQGAYSSEVRFEPGAICLHSPVLKRCISQLSSVMLSPL